MDWKILLSAAGIVLGFLSYLPYMRSIIRGKSRPHIFSWVIWGFLTGIAFFAQLADGGGPGSWITGFTAILCFVIVFLALRQGEKQITRSDIVTFIAGLSAIPAWMVTDDPLLSVVIVTAIDALGFYPTFRKSWKKPDEEMAFAYFMSGLKFAISIAALENLSIVTVLYPLSLVITNWVFVALLLARRRVTRPRSFSDCS